jgi:hypothetical protein
MGDAIELIYEGPAAFVGRLAQMLEEEDLEVAYDPPRENRSAGAIGTGVAVLLIARAFDKPIDAVEAQVAKAVKRFCAIYKDARVRGKHERP